MEITTRIAAFVTAAQTDLDSKRTHSDPKVVLSVEFGPRYARIVRALENGTSRGPFAFVDLTDGNVLRAHSLKGPSKTVLGNVLSGSYPRPPV